MTPAERIKMMIANKLNNAHEKEKVKRIIREEEVEEAKKERQREWRYQVRVSLTLRKGGLLPLSCIFLKIAGKFGLLTQMIV